jgi:hypothetical protein
LLLNCLPNEERGLYVLTFTFQVLHDNFHYAHPNSFTPAQFLLLNCLPNEERGLYVLTFSFQVLHDDFHYAHPISFTPTQFLLLNCLQHGERGLQVLAVSAAPCGHCRQFLVETTTAVGAGLGLTGRMRCIRFQLAIVLLFAAIDHKPL